jgi:hypothetical protein
VNSLRSGFKPFDTEAKDVIANIRRHASAIDSTAAIVEMAKADVFRKGTISFQCSYYMPGLIMRQVTTTHMSNQTKQELEDQQIKVRLWLKPANLDDEQRRRQKEHVKHTNKWFLAHHSFQNWLEGTTRLLWAIGKPRCGKSILASSIVAQLQNQGLQPLYFYFNSKLGTRLETGPLGLIRSFLVQIMNINSELVPTLHTLYQRSSSEEAAPFDTLWEVFRGWCSSRQQYLYCVIDALDEGLDMSEGPDGFLTTLFITLKECEMVRIVILSWPNHKIEEQMRQTLKSATDPVEPPFSEDPGTETPNTADTVDDAFHTLTAQILIEESQVRSDINIYVADRVKQTRKLRLGYLKQT